MKELKNLLKECRDVADELRRLDLIERDARRGLEEATDEDLGSTSTQRKVADARLSLDLVASRRRKLKDPWQKVQRDLATQFKAEVAAWNDRVAASKTAKEDEIVRANLPFYGDERTFRKQLNFDSVPVMFAYRKAFTDVPQYEKPSDADLVRDVVLLISHVERWSKTLGLS